nr:adenylate/guanylate cyclase domain-containing protein [Candidatus Omnitrophota bacterium]
MRKFASFLVPALVLLALLGLQYHFPNEIESVRIKVFDVFQWLHPREYRDTPVRIIDIDDESLKRFGQWPWPRSLVAELVAKLDAGGAKVIAFDAVFAEPDWTSPENVIPLWSKNPEASALLSQVAKIIDHDTLFARVIARAPVVLAFGLTPETNETRPALKSGLVEHGASGDAALRYIGPVYRGAVTALPKLEKAARGNGCFNTGAEWDSTIRRVPTFFRLNEVLYPSLVLEALRVFQEGSTYKIKLAGASGETSFGERTGFVKIRNGLLDISTDSRGRIWLYDTGYRPERFIPAWKVLEDRLESTVLDGKVLFVGSSATGIKDIRATPLDPRAPGVEIHAQLAEQMFLNDFLERPDWAEGAEFIFLTSVGLLLLLSLPRAGAIPCAFLATLAIGSAVGLSWYTFERWRFLIDPVFPSLAVLLIYLVSSFLNFLGTERERSQIRGAFGRYLSPVLVEKLAQNPNQLRLGGEMRTMSFLFTDIRNFTTLAEQMKPEALTQFMNRFLTPMTDLVLHYGGTIDKYIGD